MCSSGRSWTTPPERRPDPRGYGLSLRNASRSGPGLVWLIGCVVRPCLSQVLMMKFIPRLGVAPPPREAPVSPPWSWSPPDWVAELVTWTPPPVRVALETVLRPCEWPPWLVTLWVCSVVRLASVSSPSSPPSPLNDPAPTENRDRRSGLVYVVNPAPEVSPMTSNR